MSLQYYLENINHPEKSILLNEDTIKIGRSQDLPVCLLSVWISKHHATIKRNEENWTITDENSLNGIFVNKKRIQVLLQHVIKIGDVIQIGNSKDEPFCYMFQEKLLLKHKACKNESSSIKEHKPKMPVITDSPNNSLTFVNKSADRKVTSSPLLTTCSNSNNGNNVDNNINKNNKITSSLEETDSPVLENATSSDYELRLKELEVRLQMKEAALKIEKEKSDFQAKAIVKLEENRKQVELELVETQRLKEEERKKREQDLVEKMVKSVKKKEKSLRQDLKIKRVTLQQEQERIEKELLNKCNTDKATIDELIQSKNRLQRIIDNKDAERQLLESQLQEAKLANLKEKEVVLKTREDVLAKFNELLEMELQCSICNELFVQATTLNCSHSFCSYCIHMWMNRKNDCPVCRSSIKSQAEALVLDSYIDSVVAFFSSGMKEKRTKLVKERKALKVPQAKSRKRKSDYPTESVLTQYFMW